MLCRTGLLLALLLASACPRPAPPPASGGQEPEPQVVTEPAARLSLDQAIEQEEDQRLRAHLVSFAEGLHEEDRTRVTEHDDRWEIVVSHPSSGGSTGGAEQYFVDKVTGEATMGWHEHPMDRPGSIEVLREAEPEPG